MLLPGWTTTVDNLDATLRIPEHETTDDDLCDYFHDATSHSDEATIPNDNYELKMVSIVKRLD